MRSCLNSLTMTLLVISIFSLNYYFTLTISNKCNHELIAEWRDSFSFSHPNSIKSWKGELTLIMQLIWLEWDRPRETLAPWISICGASSTTSPSQRTTSPPEKSQSRPPSRNPSARTWFAAASVSSVRRLSTPSCRLLAWPTTTPSPALATSIALALPTDP